jgi:hypothetical protein
MRSLVLPIQKNFELHVASFRKRESHNAMNYPMSGTFPYKVYGQILWFGNAAAPWEMDAQAHLKIVPHLFGR